MIYVALAALLWGLGGALAGRFMEAIPPSVLIPLRFLLSFLLLLPLVLRFPPSARERPRLLWVGFALSGAQAFYYLAIHATTVATGIFLQYLAPALLTLYALVRGERLPLRALLGVALALLGAYALVVGPGSLVGGPLGVAYGLLSAVSFALYALVRGERLPLRALLGVALALLGAYALVVGPGGLAGGPLGVGYGLLSAVSFALYAAFSYGLKTPPLVSLGVATGVGSLLSLPVLLLHLPQVLALDLEGWGAVAYLVVFGTVVPFGLFLLGVRTFPARQATLVAMLEPVAGAVFAWPLAGEPLSPSALLGGALILAGVYLNRR